MTEKNNPKKSMVALISCSTYDENAVYEAVREGISLIGGVSKFVSAGERIVIKPSVLLGTSSEKCVCTHPSVFKAIVKYYWKRV